MSVQTKLKASDIKFDEEAQTVTICGIRYSAGMFRHFAESKEMIGWHKIRSRKGGVLHVFTVPKTIQETFDVIAGLK